MKVTFWGTRGSIPSFGEHSQIYGGNTACVSISEGKKLLILDAGSGLRKLADQDFQRDFDEVHILLTHLHMDHIQGLGFFKMFFNPKASISIWGPPSHLASLKDRLHRYLSPPLFPVRMRDFTCQLQVNEVTYDSFEIGPFKINASPIIHPGPTLGFRISNGSHSVAYIPDHEPALGSKNFPSGPEWTSGYSLAKDADLLIHDSQFSDKEYQERIGWGHCTFKQALLFAQLAEVKRLELFHHDPSHNDQKLEELYAKYVTDEWDFEVHLARENNVVEL